MKTLTNIAIGLIFFSCGSVYGMDVVEEETRISTELQTSFGTKTINLSATIFRLNADPKCPLVVLNHGTPRDPVARRNKIKMGAQSKVFVEKGFVVVVPVRRGYGDSEEEWVEDVGKCDDPDYNSVAKEVVKDIRAVVDYMKKKPYVDTTRIMMVGQSVGGFASLAYASVYPSELAGVINFAGGKGSKRPGEVCRPERLIATMGDFGKTARMPTLWIYSERDDFFPPPLPQKMFEAYKEKGGTGKLLTLTSKQTSWGHNLFFMGIATWEPIVDEFLRDIRLMK